MRDSIFYGMDNEARNDVVNSSESNFPGRSVFPYGCSTIMTMNEGYLYPVDTFFTLPGDSIDIDFASYLETINPFVDRQYSGMKLCFHAYYNKCAHEWKGWRAYSTKGHRGNVSLNLPYVPLVSTTPLLINGNCMLQTDNQTPMYASFNHQHSLLSYLVGYSGYHVPNQALSTSANAASQAIMSTHYCGANTQVNRAYTVTGETGTSLVGATAARFNAIPFAMYQRIYRDYYLNQNLVKDNPFWFPDDDDEFCLKYSYSSFVPALCEVPANKLVGYSLVPNNNSTPLPSLGSISATDKYADMPVLQSLRVRQWSGDPFTTCVPFLERNGTTMQFMTAYNALVNNSAIEDKSLVQNLPDSNSIDSSQVYLFRPDSPNSRSSLVGLRSNNQTPPIQQVNSIGVFQTLNALRELAAATLWSQRNARAKGDYNSLIRSHYGINPHSEDRSPIYLGGSVQTISFNDVVSSAETTNQPLGTKTSNASSGGRSSIAHFECSDFGYVMILASLVPTTFYTQGLRPEFDSTLVGSELPWPEFANLQKENVLLKRLFYVGTAAQDNRLIGFNERFLDYKYRSNRLLGHMNDYLDTKFRAMTFARYFDYADMTSFQSIDNEFVSLSPYTLRQDMYTVPSQPHFILQFGDNIRLVRCLPFAAKEQSLTNSL